MGQTNRISQAGLDLIKNFEGLRRRSSKLPTGGWIVGYGHTRSAREGIEVSEREAEYLLRYDLQETERLVCDVVRAPLHQNEFDALVSLAWNIGEEAFRHSDVLKYVNSGEMLAAAESFAAWRKARIDGHLIVLDALVRRRAAEKNLFLSHPAGAPAAPSLVVRPVLDSAASVLALSNGALSLENKRTEEAKATALLPAAAPELNAANSNGEAEAAETEAEAVEEAEAEEEAVAETVEEPSQDETEAEAAEPQTIEETTEEIGNRVRAEASIWDASDVVGDEELADYDEIEDDVEDDGIDDTLLAAAIAASNLSRRDDEAEDEVEETESVDETTETVAFENLSDDETTAEPVMLPDLEAADETEATASDDAQEDDATLEDNVARPSFLDDAEAESEAETVAEGAEESETDAEPVENEINVLASEQESETETSAEEVELSGLDEAEVDEDDGDAPVIEALGDEDELEDSAEAEPVAVGEAEIETVAEVEETTLVEAKVVETEEVSEVLEEAADLHEEPATLLEVSEPVEDAVVEVAETEVEAAEETNGEIWQEGETIVAETTEETTETVEALDYTSEDDDDRRVTIVDPLVSDHYPGEDNGVDADEVHAPISGSRKSAGDFWFGVFPFILLALLGAAMCVFGVMDWGGLIGSDEPVADNQLYAGPFLTLIGGFGLIFGIYFMIRKLSGVED